MTDHYFKATKGGLKARFGDEEADVLRQLIEEMRMVLSDDPPDDPAVLRLFPDAYESADDARAFRDMVEGELKSEKLAALDVVASALGEAGPVKREVPTDEVDAWLTALTDMRLALGTRLDVTEETMAHEPDPNAPQGFQMTILHWLGWLQESILVEIVRRDR